MLRICCMHSFEIPTILYYVIIYPIELFLQVVFSILYDLRPSACLAIIGVSLVVNLLLLPLYNRADRISQEERKRQDAMSYWVKHIRNAFSGDERFMMLQTYYRKQEYRPIYSLRSSISLLLQIPFFIAAYHFLSNLDLLNGYSFHFIKDLGRPDGLLIIGGISINVLPILMTLINGISIAVYTKGAPLKEKLQLCVMALLFLILLYDSPSGLVIYWTMNNVFSLVKNVVYGFRDRHSSGHKQTGSQKGGDKRLYLLGVSLLTILTGLVIPLSVVVSSPEEFITLTVYKDPLHYVFSSFCMAAGLFLLWFSVFYYLMEAKTRQVFELVIWTACGMALIDYLAFGKIKLTLSSELVYRGEFAFDTSKIILNVLVLLAAAGVMVLLWHFRRQWIVYIYCTLIAGLAVLSVINIVRTEQQLDKMSYLKNESDYKGFSLSKQGRNVVVIMLDCAKGPYIPYIFAERPELKEIYSGFTYYANTLSHGEHTLIGAPGLFGGYEYTPEGMDSRPDEKLVDKHDEALSIMPVIFSENGYETTVYDPPLAGYNDISDLSIYDPYPKVNAYSLKNRFVSPESIRYTEQLRKRQFFMYSILKSSPVFAQPFIYRGGTYHYPDTINSTALQNVDSEFTDSYAILDNLINLTEISGGTQDTFMMMDNDTTHDPRELQLPDYTASDFVDNRGLETCERIDEEGDTLIMPYPDYYHVNMAALLKIGEWLEYLKETGVYDNTRIIIVSDHGSAQGEFENLILDDGRDAEGFSPLLLYKDFGQTGFYSDESFMTNADTPMLAMNDIIDEPVNPFTGNEINGSGKTERDQLVLADNFTDTGAYVFREPGQDWYAVRDDIRIRDNWREAEGK